MILKNTFKPTIRSLLRDKSYLVVNVLSLSAGLICCLFVFTYIQDELSYDRFHEDADRIYRLEYEAVMEDGLVNRYAGLHGHVLPDWLNSVPEIELITRFAQHADLVVEAAGEPFVERNVFAADSSFFRLFTFNLIEGDPASVLAAPNSVVISQSTAQKYFDTGDVKGEVLTVSFQDREVLLTVTGVMEDVPSNSHFSFDMATSAGVYEDLYGYNLDEIQQGYIYIWVADGVQTTRLETALNTINRQHDPESGYSFFLRALTDIHLHSSVRGEIKSNGNITLLYVLAVIALIMACVNFTTLATARAAKRANETGMRKVFGAGKGDLASAFLLEGILLALVALVLAVVLAWQFLPQFNQLADKAITAGRMFDPSFLLLMMATAVIAGCISTLYPVLILISYKPVSLLFGRSTAGFKGSGTLWKSVIVAQITATLVLISASYVVHQQVRFIHHTDLGFDREQIVTFPNYFGEDPTPFMNRLRQEPGIEHVTVSSYVPGISKTSGSAQIQAEGRTDAITFRWISVDHHYLDTYGISITEGRNFSEERPTDAVQAFIINERAAADLGWEEPLGKQIEALGRDGEVIGVVEDFNFLSLHSEVEPLVMVIYESLYWTISAKVQAGQHFSETLSGIEVIWKEMVPGTPFTYNFVDDQFSAIYETEQRTQSLFLAFSVLAVIIAMSGLFSFASYTMQQKTREIGIWKVLGATVYDILKHFYSGYARLLLLAACIALPAGFIWMRSWLENFSYKTEIGPDVFAVPLILVLAILILSVSWQAVKGAQRNPVDSIRVG